MSEAYSSCCQPGIVIDSADLGRNGQRAQSCCEAISTKLVEEYQALVEQHDRCVGCGKRGCSMMDWNRFKGCANECLRVLLGRLKSKQEAICAPHWMIVIRQQEDEAALIPKQRCAFSSE